MSDLTKLVLGIISALAVAAIIAVWKLIGGKADKSELHESDKLYKEELRKAAIELDSDLKSINIRIDNFIALTGQAASKTDLIRDLNTASMRVDDKDIRVQKDIAELKSDIKTLTEKLFQVDKKLDDLPTRVAGLEQNRRVENK